MFVSLVVAGAMIGPACTSDTANDSGTSSSSSTTANPTADPTVDPTADPTADPTTDPTDPSGSPTTGSADGSTSSSSSGEPSITYTTETTAVTTESSTTDGTAGSSSTTDGTTGVVPPDVGVDPTCDVFAQDCPDGEKCAPLVSEGGMFWDDTRCVPVVREPDAVGESCTAEGGGQSGVDTCGVGAMCWEVDPGTGVGTCVALCTGTPQEPTCVDEATSCSIFNDAVLELCLPGCDPLLQDCDATHSCLPLPDFVCLPDGSGPAGAQGDACMALNACDPGLVCINGALIPGCESFGCCSGWCDTSDPGSNDVCAAAAGEGTACVPFFPGAPPPGLEDVGVCILDM